MKRLLHWITAALIVAAPLLLAQGLRYEPPVIDGHEPPFRRVGGSPFTSDAPAILKNNGTMFSDTTVIDFEKRQLTYLRQDKDGNAVQSYHYGELNDYINDSRLHSFYEEWYNKLTAEAKQELGEPPAPKLQWELAVHYPPWAQRLLGKDPPRLKIEGSLKLTVAYDYTRIIIDKDTTVDFIPLDFEPEYEFAIRGTVGRLISVNISHSRKNGFDLSEDPLKNFKVEYKESYEGELEDEIVQEIVAGYTGFDMPGTNLSGYSEKHDGLFGLKARAKIGPLMLTTVLSHAQGEAMTRELGGRNDPNSMTALRDNEFIKNRYFFLDTAYKAYNNKVYSITNPDRNAARPPRITQFQAFVSIQCNETSNSTVRRYKADMNGSEVCFRMLTENQEYIVDLDRGFVRFEYPVKEDEIIAVAMTTVDGTLNRGRIVPINTPNNETVQIEMLKPNGLDELTDAGNPLFGLMWRNVYYLPTLDDSKLDLFYLDPAMGDTIRHVTVGTTSVLISNAMGLTDEQGRARIENIEIFKSDKQELIIPPWNTNMNGNEPFANTALNDPGRGVNMANDMIYRFGLRNTAMRDYVPKFGILTNGIMKRTTYDDLGWNILPGTVIVKTNSGTQLVEGEDYNLDYEMGILDLLSTRAKSAESILITYQRESDFVLEKKVFAGLRGEMRLPFISDNSFMAASVLYQSAATTAGDLPQLGNEPFSKLHLSFNTSLDFQPEWMTKAVNFIPLVKTEEESSAKVDFEIVHSRMNPNTSVDKGAYIDDFERTKDGYTLSMRHTVWHPSHYPFKYSGGADAIADSMLNKLRIPAWDFYWYTPNTYDEVRRINRLDVWQRDKNSRYSSSDTYIDILSLNATPASREHPLDVQDRFKNSYASITASFGRSGLNMENHRYLEIVVNPKGSGQLRKKGKLMIQIGTFSHDQVRDGGPPNERFDLEDPTYQNKPAQLSMYDKGLNGRDAADKFYMIPNAAAATGWDTLSRNRNTELLVFPRGRDNPSGDLFRKYDKDNLSNFRYVNGTWENSFYDDENIDGDGIPRINITEKYYSYEIDLDLETSLYIDGTSRVVSANGWRFYRIPLKEVLDGISVIKDSALGGAPEWAKARGLRLVWYDFDERVLTSENELLIAGIELSGNYWEPSAGSEAKIEATSISNYEDSYYYDQVYGTIVKIKSGEVTPEEKSLRLNFPNLKSGDTAVVRRLQVGNPQNISGYDSVSIMVHSMKPYGDDLKFVFRFGSDDSTYYEYSAPLNWGPGWRTHTFSLQDLSDLKHNADFENNAIDAVSGRLRVVAPANKRPNFTAITFMAVGAVCARGPINDTVEIWVNELIATGGRVLSGVAARVNIATQWADFLTLGAGVSFTDGDFKTMTDATLGGSDKSELSANINAVMKLDKFMPEDWGVSIPVGGSISGALSRPTVKPQSDIRLLNDDGDPDGFLDMVDDAFNMMLGGEPGGDRTRAQRYETFASTRNAYTSFEKTSESENPFVNFTLDRIKTDVSYNQTASYTGKGPQEDTTKADYIKTDTTVTYTGALRYDLSPRNPPSWTSYTPFAETGWMPEIHKKYTLNLLPSTINFDLAEIQHRTEIRNDLKLNVDNFRTRTFDMRHGMNVEYSPIDPLLTFGYTIRLDRDLADLPTDDWNLMMDSTLVKIFGLNSTEGEKWDTYGVLYGERGRTQSASAKLTPQFVQWMTHSGEYTADYTGLAARRDNDSTRYINANVSTALRLRTSLLLSELFKPVKPKTPAAKDTAAVKDTAAAKKDTAAKASNGYWALIGSGINKINLRSVNFEYDVSTELKNGFLSSTYLADTVGMSNYDFIRYQMGMRRGLSDYLFGTLGEESLGWMQYRMRSDPESRLLDLYRNDQSKGSWAARFSTAFSIPDPFKVDFTGVSFGWGREFYGQPDSTYIDTTVVLPEIRAGANTKALIKLAFIKKYFSDLGASSSFSFKNSRKESKERTDTTITVEFQPLISFEGKLIKWPSLTGNYRFGTSTTNIYAGGKDSIGSNTGRLSAESTVRTSHTLTLAYAFTGAGKLKELRLRKWVIPVQGKTTVGLGVNWETSERTNKIGDDDDAVTWESVFSYSPYLDYVFTKNIKGQARYLGSHKNQDGKLTLNQRFELTAEVTF